MLSALIPAANDDYSLSLSLPAIAPHVDEVIVYDDCSVDRTANVLETLRDRFPNIRLVCNAELKPLGWYEVRNRLLDMTAAQHLLFIDADDIFDGRRARELRSLATGDGPAHVRLGLIEAVGDFRHGTGRGWTTPHYDPCHVYLDRGRLPKVEWKHNHTFSFVDTGGTPKGKTDEVLFCHAKRVKSDWRLIWRDYVRLWIRRGRRDAIPVMPSEVHGAAMRTLFSSRMDPVRRLPENIRLPEPCWGEGRFRVLYEAGKPVDRMDYGWGV